MHLVSQKQHSLNLWRNWSTQLVCCISRLRKLNSVWLRCNFISLQRHSLAVIYDSIENISYIFYHRSICSSITSVANIMIEIMVTITCITSLRIRQQSWFNYWRNLSFPDFLSVILVSFIQFIVFPILIYSI